MEKWLQIKKDYLAGMRVSDICNKYKIPAEKVYNKISNNKWGKEKKAIEGKLASSIEELIRITTFELIEGIRKDAKKKDCTMKEKTEALKAINDINGLKKYDATTVGKDEAAPPQFNLIQLSNNNSNISDIPKLDKLANNNTIIDVEADR